MIRTGGVVVKVYPERLIAYDMEWVTPESACSP
jgi:hypothetical protein